VSELEKWILGIGGMVIGGLIVAFWKHVIEDGKMRERVAALETDNETTKEEVRGLRKHWHDFRDGTMKDAWKLFDEWRSDMVRRFGTRDKDE
jgi:hypothetical protein